MADRAIYDQNKRFSILAASNGDGNTPVQLWADPNTHRLLVDASASITDGTNIASVVAGDTGFNGVVVSSGVKTISFTTSTPGAQTIAANTDCRGYSWIEVVYTSVGSGLALTGQFSTASGGTYIATATWAQQNGILTGGLGATSGIIYNGPVKGNFFQIAVSALTSGTFAGTITLRAIAPPSGSVSAGQSGTWSVGANSATGSTIPANAFFIGGYDGTNLTGLRVGAVADAFSGTGVLNVISELYNGASLDKPRTPTIFKSVQATASGNTAVWTPTSGKKFRLMRFKVQVTGNATLGGAAVLTVGFQDATTDIGVTHDVYVPAAALNTMTGYDSGWIDLGNGKVSASANNVLNVNLSAAITAGNARVIVCGTEE